MSASQNVLLSAQVSGQERIAAMTSELEKFDRVASSIGQGGRSIANAVSPFGEVVNPLTSMSASIAQYTQLSFELDRQARLFRESGQGIESYRRAVMGLGTELGYVAEQTNRAYEALRGIASFTERSNVVTSTLQAARGYGYSIPELSGNLGQLASLRSLGASGNMAQSSGELLLAIEGAVARGTKGGFAVSREEITSQLVGLVRNEVMQTGQGVSIGTQSGLLSILGSFNASGRAGLTGDLGVNTLEAVSNALIGSRGAEEVAYMQAMSGLFPNKNYYQLRKELDKGIDSPEKLNAIIAQFSGYTSDPDANDYIASQMLGMPAGRFEQLRLAYETQGGFRRDPSYERAFQLMGGGNVNLAWSPLVSQAVAGEYDTNGVFDPTKARRAFATTAGSDATWDANIKSIEDFGRFIGSQTGMPEGLASDRLQQIQAKTEANYLAFAESSVRFTEGVANFNLAVSELVKHVGGAPGGGAATMGAGTILSNPLLAGGALLYGPKLLGGALGGIRGLASLFSAGMGINLAGLGGGVASGGGTAAAGGGGLLGGLSLGPLAALAALGYGSGLVSGEIGETIGGSEGRNPWIGALAGPGQISQGVMRRIMGAGGLLGGTGLGRWWAGRDRQMAEGNGLYASIFGRPGEAATPGEGFIGPVLPATPGPAPAPDGAGDPAARLVASGDQQVNLLREIKDLLAGTSASTDRNIQNRYGVGGQYIPTTATSGVGVGATTGTSAAAPRTGTTSGPAVPGVPGAGFAGASPQAMQAILDARSRSNGRQSPFTGQMLADIEAQTGVPAALLMGILAKESQFGTDDGGLNSVHNYGGIKATEADIAAGRFVDRGEHGKFRTFENPQEYLMHMANLLLSDMYAGKSLEEVIGNYYVGPQAYAAGGTGAVDSTGGANGTVQDYLNLVLQIIAQLFGGSAPGQGAVPIGKGTPRTGTPTGAQPRGGSRMFGNRQTVTQLPNGPYSHGGKNAVDFAGGGSVYAPAGGTIAEIVNNVTRDGGKTDGGGFGNYIKVDMGNGQTYTVAHLAPGALAGMRPGMAIEAGAYLGEQGSTGYSTGIHSHVQLDGADEDVLEWLKRIGAIDPNTAYAEGAQGGEHDHDHDHSRAATQGADGMRLGLSGGRIPGEWTKMGGGDRTLRFEPLEVVIKDKWGEVIDTQALPLIWSDVAPTLRQAGSRQVR